MAWQPLSEFFKTEIAMSPVVRFLRVVIAIVLVIIAIYWIWQAIEAWNAYPYVTSGWFNYFLKEYILN